PTSRHVWRMIPAPSMRYPFPRSLSTKVDNVRRVAIIGGNRIPFARSNSAYSHASNHDMLTATLNGLVERYKLQGKRLGEVVGGAVMKHSRDFNLVRESVLSTDRKS